MNTNNISHSHNGDHDSARLDDPLLGANDPFPFEIYNAEGAAPLVIVSDHAGRLVPHALGHLGLPQDCFDQHIAYDIGADAITRCLADRLNARAVIARYSRLVIDLNRNPCDDNSIPKTSDQIQVPANQNLSDGDRQRRVQELHTPYHNAIKQQISTLAARDNRPPVLFSIHSFTPSMNGVDRMWDMGVLWNKDPRMPVVLLEHLRRWDGLKVGDNEPYSGQDLAFTIDKHGTNQGIANCAVEIRQDHCATGEEACHWADILGDALRHILTIKNLHEVQQY